MKRIKQFLGFRVNTRTLNAGALAGAPVRSVTPDARQKKRIAPGTPDPGFCLNFRSVPLEIVLDYLSEATGLMFRVKPNVDTECRVDVWHSQPVDHEYALILLKQALKEKGYTVIENGRILTIIRSQDAKKHYIPLPMAGNNSVSTERKSPFRVFSGDLVEFAKASLRATAVFLRSRERRAAG